MADEMPGSGRDALMRRIQRAALFAAALLFTAFVLLPIVWMLVTALKRPGQGLRFDFIPTRTVKSRPYPVEVGGPRVVIIEFRDAAAQQVSVSGELTGDKAVPLERAGAR